MATYRLVLGGELTARTVTAASAPPLAASKGYWARETNDPPSFNPAYEGRSGPNWTITPPSGGNEGTAVAGYTVTSRPLATVKAERKAALADHRYAKETGGITLGGAAVRTDRESQALVTGAYALVQAAPETILDWKGAGGWAQLDAATMTAIALAVGAHIQACFSNERTHAEAIDALDTVAAVAAYDFTTGWPSA
jgi:hypothetical protein